MYTGTQKKAIVIKPGKNSIFDEAYFILKDDPSSVQESEMIREANRILKNNVLGGYFFENEKKETPKNGKNGLVYFLLGALISFIICALMFLLVK